MIPDFKILLNQQVAIFEFLVLLILFLVSVCGKGKVIYKTFKMFLIS